MLALLVNPYVFLIPTVLLVAVVGFLYLNQYLRIIPGIPYMPGLPYIGIALDLLPINGNYHSHDKVLSWMEKNGPLSQYFVFGRHTVLINDAKVAKQAMDLIRDKGSVHVSRIDGFFCK